MRLVAPTALATVVPEPDIISVEPNVKTTISAVVAAWRFGRQAMVEEFIPGRELTVGVMGDRALAVTEIVAKAGSFYDYESKYGDGGSLHVVPAAVPPEITAQACGMAVI